MIGLVQWFNFKKGFGNIKVIEPGNELNDNTYFVHYTNISSDSNFKRLYPGEYVSFEVGEHDGKETSINVRGVNDGPLLIDQSEYSYRVVKSYKSSSNDDDDDNNNVENDDSDVSKQ